MRVDMRESRISTMVVPAIGGDAATLFKATDRPVRVLVRNVGGVAVFIAHNSLDLGQVGVVSGTFQLPTGMSEVFVLAPTQGLFGAGAGVAGLVSIAVSEAIPVFMES